MIVRFSCPENVRLLILFSCSVSEQRRWCQTVQLLGSALTKPENSNPTPGLPSLKNVARVLWRRTLIEMWSQRNHRRIQNVHLICSKKGSCGHNTSSKKIIQQTCSAPDLPQHPRSQPTLGGVQAWSNTPVDPRRGGEKGRAAAYQLIPAWHATVMCWAAGSRLRFKEKKHVSELIHETNMSGHEEQCFLYPWNLLFCYILLTPRSARSKLKWSWCCSVNSGN